MYSISVVCVYMRSVCMYSMCVSACASFNPPLFVVYTASLPATAFLSHNTLRHASRVITHSVTVCHSLSLCHCVTVQLLLCLLTHF